MDGPKSAAFGPFVLDRKIETREETPPRQTSGAGSAPGTRDPPTQRKSSRSITQKPDELPPLREEVTLPFDKRNTSPFQRNKKQLSFDASLTPLPSTAAAAGNESRRRPNSSLTRGGRREDSSDRDTYDRRASGPQDDGMPQHDPYRRTAVGDDLKAPVGRDGDIDNGSFESPKRGEGQKEDDVFQFLLPQTSNVRNNSSSALGEETKAKRRLDQKARITPKHRSSSDPSQRPTGGPRSGTSTYGAKGGNQKTHFSDIDGYKAFAYTTDTSPHASNNASALKFGDRSTGELFSKDKRSGNRRAVNSKSNARIEEESAEDEEEDEDDEDYVAGFEVLVHGVLECCECPELPNLFCRTYVVKGNDWTEVAPVSGDRLTQAEVITQLSDSSKSPFPVFVFNCPFEFRLHSTNISGWPQITVSLHTLDGGGGPATKEEVQSPPGGITARHLFPFFSRWSRGGEEDKRRASEAAAIANAAKDNEKKSKGSGGKDQCVGYARCRIPLKSGRHTLELPIMQIQHSTSKFKWAGLITGTRPELRDPTFLCTGEDRVVLSARPLTGFIRISVDVLINGMESCGFDIA